MLLWLSELLRLISCSVGNARYCVTGIRLSLQYAALKGGYNAISYILSYLHCKELDCYARARTQRPEREQKRAAQHVSFSHRKSSAAQQYLLEKNVSKDEFLDVRKE